MIQDIKKDFPIFETAENKDLIYLDNGATTHKPSILLNAISHYYTYLNSNIGRGVYSLAEKSGEAYDNSRKIVAQFIQANPEEITFTSGATDGLNQAAYIVGQHLKPGQKIILSILEHHANILPWQRLAKEKKLELVFIKDNHILNHPEQLDDNFWHNVGVIALTHVSNVTGQIHPIAKWCHIAQSKKIISVIDGAQGITSTLLNMKSISCDFYAFSAHKLYGPMGVGVLYINKNFITASEPLRLGGGIIEDVLEQEYSLLDSNIRFESGTPNVADVYAFSEVLNYLTKNNWSQLVQQTHQLGEYLYQQLKDHPHLTIVNQSSRDVFKHSHTLSFEVKGIHSHDVGTYLAHKNIAVRVGKHCTHPLHSYLKTNSSVRVSLGIYNTKEDIKRFIQALNECIQFFEEI